LGRRLRQAAEQLKRGKMLIMREREPPFDPLGQLYIGGEGAAI